MVMKGISTWMECVRLPVVSAFIVFLGIQLFVGLLVLSSLSILLPAKAWAMRRPCSLTRIHIRPTYRSVKIALRPPLFISRPRVPPSVSQPLGTSLPIFKLSARKDDTVRASSPLVPCRAGAPRRPPVSSQVAELSFPFRYRLVARL